MRIRRLAVRVGESWWCRGCREACEGATCSFPGLAASGGAAGASEDAPPEPPILSVELVCRRVGVARVDEAGAAAREAAAGAAAGASALPCVDSAARGLWPERGRA